VHKPLHHTMPLMPSAQPATATDLVSATRWITAAATQHGATLCSHVVARLGTSRSSAHTLLRKLVAAQWLVRDGTPQHPIYRPGALRQVVHTCALADAPPANALWQLHFAPCFDLPLPLQDAARLAFTELLHNVARHSSASRMTVSVRQTPQQLQLLVCDDGSGLFAGSLAEPQALVALGSAMAAGQGLRSCAQLADVLDVQAAGQAFQHRAWEQTAGSPAVWRAGRLPASRQTALPLKGTRIYMAVALQATPSMAYLANLQTALTMLQGCAQRSAALQVAKPAASSDLANLEHVGATRVAHGLAAGDGVGVAGAQHAQLYQQRLGLGQGLVAVS
jgi:anti-sigma regulatory factor (Ser/Thr protein kinase)